MKFKKPPLRIQPTTLWDYPSQDYGDEPQGRPGYKGATPSYIIWNLLQRYTQPKDLVVDPCAGSGTTLDVARDLGRRALGYDLTPARKDTWLSTSATPSSKAKVFSPSALNSSPCYASVCSRSTSSPWCVTTK